MQVYLIKRLFVLLLFFSIGLAWAQAFELEPLIPFVEALPRQTVTLLLRVENTDDDEHSVQPRLELPPGWRLLVPPQAVLLEPGEARAFRLDVLIGLEAAAGDYALTARLDDPLAPLPLEATFTVRVLQVGPLELRLFEAPEQVTAAPYEVRFVARNAGDAVQLLRFSASDNLGLPLRLSPQEVQLAPGAEVEVVVTVEELPLEEAAVQLLQLVAEDVLAPPSRVALQVVVALVPLELVVPGFPLLIEGIWHIDEGLVAGAFELSLSGSGRLRADDPTLFSFQLDPDRTFFEYLHPNLRLAFGDQRFVLSPLSEPGTTGFGLDLNLNDEFLFLQLFSYGRDEAWRLGLRAATLGEEAQASLGFLLQPELPGHLLTGQLQLFPALALGTALNLELEGGLQTGDPASAALRLGASATAGPLSLTASRQDVEAGYRGSQRVLYMLAASASLRLSEVPPFTLAARWSEESEQGVGEAQLERYRLRVGATLSGQVEGSSWSLQYDLDDETRGAVGTSQRRDLILRLGLPVTTNVRLQQSLGWQRRTGHDSLLYEASSRIPYTGGSLSPSLIARYGLTAGADHRLDFGLEWSGQLTEALSLRAKPEIKVFGSESFRFTGSGSYVFPNKHSLFADAQIRFLRDREVAVQLSLGYSLSLNLPLGQAPGPGPAF